MTIVKTIWDLRGELQIAINNKDEQKFREVRRELNSPGLEFEVMQTKIASSYQELETDAGHDILSRPKQLEKIRDNVKYLRLCRMENRKIHPKFGKEESVLHTIWELRSKFERLKYCFQKYDKNFKSNEDLYMEIITTITYLLENPTKYFTSYAEHDAMLNIKEEINVFFNKAVLEVN